MSALLTLAYDGTAYAGWQRQKNALAVQQVLEEALSKLLGGPVSVIGGGRTDAGVHARGQRALITRPAVVAIPASKLPHAVNTLLPADIRVTGAEDAPEGFHPLRAGSVKSYTYAIDNAPIPSPLRRLYAAFVREPLDIRAMRDAAAFFVGRHDFKAFAATGGSAATTTREVYALDIGVCDGLVNITITGNGFLYNMVRIITGTLVAVGHKKMPPETVRDIILSRDRKRAGKTMPAHGLTLDGIRYV